MATVVLLIVLRVALGWHFLYEGVWKIKNPDKFAAEAEGFLTGARGPAAGMFYAMVPDIDGRQRLDGKLEYVKEVVKDQGGKPVKDAKGKEKTVEKPVLRNEARTAQWDALCLKFVALHSDLQEDARKVYEKHLLAVERYLGDNWTEASGPGTGIQAYFGSLDRFEEAKKSSPNTPYRNGRNWDEMKKLRSQAKDWLTELDAREKAYKVALRELVPEEDRGGKDPFARGINIFAWTRIEQVSFGITWGLTAIGLCLMLGFCTRPAALGAGVFMLFVVLSQPSYPGVIPPDPPQLGHAMVVNKDFVEMIALFLVATTAVGHWAGLDYFLYNFIVNPFLSRTIYRKKAEG
jgi:uncharacterized membrane protein YphA (DoxX/SURF4 family)